MFNKKIKPKKQRADQLVFDAGLVESREQAKRYIMAGKVFILPLETNQAKIKVEKAGQQLSADTRFELIENSRFVSRGAYKLLTALEHFNIDVNGFVALDAGASTGGFSDCLVQLGASKVYAVDVGYNQLHEKLKKEKKIISLEKVNLRTADQSLLPEKVDILVVDVSFISLTLILPACEKFLKPNAKIVALIKPQFELGPGNTEKGIVKSQEKQEEAVNLVLDCVKSQLSWTLIGTVPSNIKGSKGNQEFLAYWEKT
ncbi:TlyA family RNA methyltransferase [Desulfovibrio litoralis]|uniref:23S rRNA (Cytidine1920-2'-O)/16S rRNA (Cytidine1409-2'-O)-methyltransferase n=1 Tax=Desulfovibrio litoralis DSM 11393 TaxID=1121455 RepID=A0A1M7TJG7_9BACT|nr:TlyA family RNA methyltransferase [Desulfovibrio litoralis]SHN70783.1 23S rRNA (cytidine1920-2'-O)/16S rRNA (cytidine1409-2'-O)-methyltransferase [Desulfovibrio litoralis DSM 11393]